MGCIGELIVINGQMKNSSRLQPDWKLDVFPALAGFAVFPVINLILAIGVGIALYNDDQQSQKGKEKS